MNLSWSNFFSTVILILVLYYTAVAFIFYRTEIQEFIVSRRKKLSGTGNPGAPRPDTEELFEGMEAFVQEIDSFLVKAGNKASKEGLLAGLKQRLASFAGLGHPAYRVAVLNHIIGKADEICGVKFSERELDG